MRGQRPLSLQKTSAQSAEKGPFALNLLMFGPCQVLQFRDLLPFTCS